MLGVSEWASVHENAEHRPRQAYHVVTRGGIGLRGRREVLEHLQCTLVHITPGVFRKT